MIRSVGHRVQVFKVHKITPVVLGKWTRITLFVSRTRQLSSSSPTDSGRYDDGWPLRTFTCTPDDHYGRSSVHLMYTPLKRPHTHFPPMNSSPWRFFEKHGHDQNHSLQDTVLWSFRSDCRYDPFSRWFSVLDFLTRSSDKLKLVEHKPLVFFLFFM